MGVFLLAPAGSFEALSAALANGADAVYFGVGALNMRSRGAVNFTEADLPLSPNGVTPAAPKRG